MSELDAQDVAYALSIALEAYPRCTCDGAFRKMLYRTETDWSGDRDENGVLPKKNYPLYLCETCNGRIPS